MVDHHNLIYTQINTKKAFLAAKSDPKKFVEVSSKLNQRNLHGVSGWIPERADDPYWPDDFYYRWRLRNA